MFAAEVRNNIKVWVRLGQRADAALVPGIVTDDRVGNRNLIRRGGPLTVQNSVVVISLGMITSSGPTVITRTGPTPDRLDDL